ncbi:MAG: type II secretion system F family protein [Rhodovibrionaceae bacterium]
MENWQVVVAALGAALGAILLLYAFLGDANEAAVKRRMSRVSFRDPILQAAAKRSLRISDEASSIASLDDLAKRLLPNPEMLRQKLARTGRRISIGQFGLLILTLTGVSATAFHYGAAFPWLLSYLAGAIVGIALPYKMIGFLGNRRVAKFLKIFPEAIDLIIRGLRSGLPVSESISTVATEMPDPIGIEFRRISDAVRLGDSLESAMWKVARRIDVPEYKFLIIAMSIQRETGGNLAETLHNLSELLRKRQQLKLKIRAMSSEARASAWIIGSLPFLMFGILLLINPEYVMLLFSDNRGLFMVGGALLMILIGILVMAKMVRFEI